MTTEEQEIDSNSRSQCCPLPHGKMVLFPTISLSIASVCSVLTLANCSFVVSESATDQFGFMHSPSTGFWPGCMSAQYGVNGIIVDEIEDAIQDDVARKVSMAFGIVACIIGTIATILLWPITCKLYKTRWIEVIGILVTLALICQLATFSMFRTEYCDLFGCKLGWGGVMSIVAATFLLLGDVGIWMIPIKSKRTVNPTQEQAVNSGDKVESSERGISSSRSQTSDAVKCDEPSDIEVGIERSLHDSN